MRLNSFHQAAPRLKAILLLFLAFAAIALGQPAAQAALALETTASGFAQPVFLTHAPGDAQRLFVVEQPGRIKIVRKIDGVTLGAPFLDITDRVDASDTEEGLLGLAFHPNYANNGLFFVNYVHTTTQRLTRISRFKVKGNPTLSNLADPGSEVILMTYDQPYRNHNAGMIDFGPNDGYLYIATGDGGGSNDPELSGQNLNSRLGKILRIDVNEGGLGAGTGGANYDIPASNPFAGSGGVQEEVWAYGLRNPWRFSFDRETGNLYIADVGQWLREEINFQPSSSSGGENYGWRILEGTHCNTPTETQTACDNLTSATAPIHEYDHTTGTCIIGGYCYRGSGVPSIQGTYFFADFGSNKVWSFKYESGAVTNFQDRTQDLDPSGAIVSNIASFGEDDSGEIYLVKRSGTIYRIVDEQAQDDTLIEIAATKDATLYESPAGDLANASGDHLFAGRTGQTSLSIRRALLAFDIAGNVPAGATITGAALTLKMSRSNAGENNVTLKKAAKDWGEGASNASGNEGGGAAAQPGDTTWQHTFFDTQFWTAPGGDTTGAISASTPVNAIGSYDWFGQAMVDDIQGWLDSGSNFGWFLLGNETTGDTSKRFDSRSHPTPLNRPRLTVSYSTIDPGVPEIKWADFTFAGFENGTENNPFNTIAEAVDAVIAGGTIKLKPGESPETLLLAKAMTITAVGGAARIGVAGAKSPPFSSAPPNLVQDNLGVIPPTQTTSTHGFTAHKRTGHGEAKAGLTPETTAFTGAQDTAIYATVFPSELADTGQQLARPASTLAVRLRSETPLDSGSVWGAILGAPENTEVRWLPVGDGPFLTDAWIIAEPPGDWPLGSIITLSGGASTLRHGPGITTTGEFLVIPDPGTPQGTVLYQPNDVEGFRTDTDSAPVVMLLAPRHAQNHTPEFLLAPDQVFTTPRRVWIPVPEGIDPATAQLLYFHSGPGPAGWYPARQIQGWVEPDSIQRLEVQGIPYLTLLIHHGAHIKMK